MPRYKEHEYDSSYAVDEYAGYEALQKLKQS